MTPWIKVENGLPEVYTRVLTYSRKSGVIRIDYLLCLPDPIWEGRFDRNYTEVTHWTELLDSPRQED
jgi:hypothetical protein